MSKMQTQLVAGVALLAIGVIIGHFLVPANFFPAGSKFTDIFETGNTYTFINPLLFCSDQEISNFTNATPQKIEREVTEYIEKQKSEGGLADASVYYKDLNGGPWVLINSSMRTVPASLLKVPVAISIYKQAEKDPAFLKKKVTRTDTTDKNGTQYFYPAAIAKPNTPYTVEQLTALTLEQSDNNALYLLGTTLSDEQFAESYADLGIEIPDEPQPRYTIDVKTYASFFRVLFNASYLNQENSEHVLSLLAQSNFHQGLEAGVPNGTVVAHKFGEYTVSSTDVRLNDCGIIYRPHDPYILCVLTAGNDFKALAKNIGGISEIVYAILKNQ